VSIEWTLTRQTLNQIDDELDRRGIFAKGYWENVDGTLTVTGLRVAVLASRPGERLVAKFNDTISINGRGRVTVTPAGEEEK